MKKLYSCLHSHRNGYTTYLAWGNRELTKEDFMRQFSIYYEEDTEGENLEIRG